MTDTHDPATGGNTGQVPSLFADTAPTTPPGTAPENAPADPAAEIARLTRELEKARKEAAASRVNAKKAAAEEARRELLAQLSGQSDEPPTVEELQQRLAEQQSSAQEAQADALAAALELTVYRTAARLGADAEALIDSRSFVDSLDRLDVDLADRAAVEKAVAEHIKAYVEANPRYRATPAAGRSGIDHGAGAGEVPQTLEAQIANAQKRGDWRTALRLQNTKLIAAMTRGSE